jgi:hypothetical protein
MSAAYIIQLVTIEPINLINSSNMQEMNMGQGSGPNEYHKNLIDVIIGAGN